MSFLAPRAALLSRGLIAPQSLQRRKLSIANGIPSYAPRKGLRYLLWSVTGGLCLVPLWLRYHKGHKMQQYVRGMRVVAQSYRSHRLYPSVDFDSFRSSVDHYRDLVMPVLLHSLDRAQIDKMFDTIIEWQEKAVDEERLTQLHDICRNASREVYDILEKNSARAQGSESIGMVPNVLFGSVREFMKVFQETRVARLAMLRSQLDNSRRVPDGSDWEAKG